MAQGSPGNPPPTALQKALADAAALPETARYVDDFGDPPLRRLLAEEMKVVYGDNGGEGGVDVVMEDVALTAGGNMAFVAAVMTLADAGDEVIIPSPWYFNHQMTLDLLGIRTVVLPCKPEAGFVPSVEVCETLITERTRAIALVSPNNPTGATYPPSLLTSFAQLARSKQIALILDETYRDFILDDPPHSLFNRNNNNNNTSHPPWRTYLIHLFSFSKSYAIPGLRLGAIIANPLFLNKVKTVLDCLQICASRVPQVALHTNDLLPRLRRDVKEMARRIGERHRVFREGVPDGWTVGSQGGYFAYVRHPFGVDSRVVCRRLAEEMGVLALPDYMFNPMGGEKEEGEGEKGEKGAWIRFSVANLDEGGIRQVCERLEDSRRVLG